MLLDDKSAAKRLESPNNLMNRLKALRERASSPSLPSTQIIKRSETQILSIPPSAEDLIDNLETKLLYGQAHKNALTLLVNSLSVLDQRLPEIDKAEEVSKVALNMGKILHGIKMSQNLDRNKIENNNKVQINIYAPQFKEVQDYETINLVE